MHQHSGHGHGHGHSAVRPLHKGAGHLGGRTPTYSKIFRWSPDAGGEQPHKVEIIGTFTQWEPVALHHDKNSIAWQVTMPEIPSHKTHHYMLLVDGKPTQDKNSDGLAIAHGAQEEKYALMTARGPRVFMLFAQSK